VFLTTSFTGSFTGSLSLVVFLVLVFVVAAHAVPAALVVLAARVVKAI
jgi:hypothetical protein